MIDTGIRASQPSMKFFSQARSTNRAARSRSAGDVHGRPVHPSVVAKVVRCVLTAVSVRVKLEAGSGRPRNACIGKSPRRAARCHAADRTFAVPMVDTLGGPVRAERTSGRGRTDRVVTNLGVALRMRRYAGAELLGEHLSAQADAEKRTPFLRNGTSIQSISRRT